MSFYCWYQQKSGQSAWHLALDSDRERIANEIKPEFFTVLSCDNNFTEEMTREVKDRVKFKPLFYFDFDAQDIAEAIQQCQAFLVQMQAKGLDLDTVKAYCSGSKGFHLEIGAETFIGKVPQTGIAHFHTIHKEVAHTLFVDTMDIRVYSIRRMWRAPNVQRDNSKFKVQVSIPEVMGMTVERYQELISTPRPLFPVAPAKYTPELGLIYSTARDKIEGAIKKRGKVKVAPSSLAKFGGKWPETIQLILAGGGLKEEVGFNQIAIQIAAAAHALGIGEDQFLADAAGLIETHQGDGDRYGTPAKRRASLREMWRYMEDHPSFEYSAGGILALCVRDIQRNHDLGGDGPAPIETVTKTITKTVVQEVVAEDGTKSEVEVQVEEVVEEEVEVEDDESSIRVTRDGIYVLRESGWSKACAVGWANPVRLKSQNGTAEGNLIGYEIDVFRDGTPVGRHMIGMDKLTSRTSFQSWSMQWSASMKASDIQTSGLADLLHARTAKQSANTWVITTEGLNLITPPGAKSADEVDLVWASPYEIVGVNKGQYKFRPALEKEGIYKSDLHTAADLTLEDEGLVGDLLEVNSTQNVAKILGWFSSSFLNAVYRRYYNQFPLLQVYGQAKAGKSKTVELFSHLCYHLSPPKILQSSGQTNFPIIAAVASSASMPAIFEEMKRREMNKQAVDFLMNIFRNNYNGHTISRGALSRDTAAKEVIVNEYANRAPLAFIGEAVESQAAVLDRCVLVAMSVADRRNRGDAFDRCEVRKTDLGRIGKALMQSALAIDLKAFREAFASIRLEVKAALGDAADGADRPIYNMAVVIMGLRFLKLTLQRTFGDTFDARLDKMMKCIVDSIGEQVPTNMSEASRTLDVISQLTRIDDVSYQLQLNKDYTLAPVVGKNGATFINVDLKLKPAYAKYASYVRKVLGEDPLFDNDRAFIQAMLRYEGVLAKACPDNEILFRDAFEPIMRFSGEFMASERIETFGP